MIGCFKQSYRVIKIFTLLKAINCLFSLYISIKAFPLCLLTTFNLIILFVSSKYERNLRKKLSFNDNNNNNIINNRNCNISTISDNTLSPIYEENLTTASLDPPPPYCEEPPPPYSEKLTKLPQIC